MVDLAMSLAALAACKNGSLLQKAKQRLRALFFFNNYESQNSNFLGFVTHLGHES
jgi:hypothetical protein